MLAYNILELLDNKNIKSIIEDVKPITQESPMGCAIACTASLAGLSYKRARQYFDNGKLKDSTCGFYNRDIISALDKIGIKARAYSAERLDNKKIKTGTIVFIERSQKYPAGHYLLKTKNGWLNPWINYPNITPAKAGFQKTLPSKIRWIIVVDETISDKFYSVKDKKTTTLC